MPQAAPATSPITPASLPPGLSRVGAVCALLGGVGYLALSVAHGNLPSTSGPPALRFVATRPGWPAIYLGLLACVLLWPLALAALANSIVREPARLLGWLAVAGVLVGAAVFAVDAALNGLALKTVADQWASAPSAALLQLGEAMVRLAYATFSTYLMVLLGLPFLLAGLAMATSGSYPAWLGLVGAAAGAGALVGGATRFLGLHGVVPDGLLFGVFVLAGQGWLVLVGVLLWRQAAPAPPLERQPTPDHRSPGEAKQHRGRPLVRSGQRSRRCRPATRHPAIRTGRQGRPPRGGSDLPGPHTSLTEQLQQQAPGQWRKRMAAAVPLGRLGPPRTSPGRRCSWSWTAPAGSPGSPWMWPAATS